jgi:hypothetical protein
VGFRPGVGQEVGQVGHGGPGRQPVEQVAEVRPGIQSVPTGRRAHAKHDGGGRDPAGELRRVAGPVLAGDPTPPVCHHSGEDDPVGQLAVAEVAVNSLRNDGPECLSPVA